MNKNYIITAITISLLVAPGLIMAESLVETEGTMGVNASLENQHGVNPETIREKLRAGIQAKVTNAKNNEDYRNAMLNNRPPMMHTATSTWMASTTMGEKMRELMKARNEDRKDNQGEDRNHPRVDKFNQEKTRIIRQLQQALDNLKQIRTRIAARIDKFSTATSSASTTPGTRNMTEAKRLLTIADGKIVTAQNAVNALVALSPSATSTITASTTVDLTKPRQAADTAIKAVKDAKKALNDVVVAIAHAMGLKLGQEGDRGRESDDDRNHNGTSTPPVTGTTTATTTTI